MKNRGQQPQLQLCGTTLAIGQQFFCTTDCCSRTTHLCPSQCTASTAAQQQQPRVDGGRRCLWTSQHQQINPPQRLRQDRPGLDQLIRPTPASTCPQKNIPLSVAVQLCQSTPGGWWLHYSTAARSTQGGAGRKETRRNSERSRTRFWRRAAKGLRMRKIGRTVRRTNQLARWHDC